MTLLAGSSDFSFKRLSDTKLAQLSVTHVVCEGQSLMQVPSDEVLCIWRDSIMDLAGASVEVDVVQRFQEPLLW